MLLETPWRQYAIRTVSVLWFCILCFSADPRPSKAGEPILRTSTAAAFDYFEDTLPAIRDLLSGMESAPERSLFSRDKESYQDDLDEYLDDAIALLLPETPLKIRSELRRLDSELESLREERFNRDAARILGQGNQDERSEIKGVITSVIGDNASDLIFGMSVDDKIDSLEKQRQILILDFQDNMEKDFGTRLTVRQCESLLYQVNGEDLLRSIFAAKVLTEIEAHIRVILMSSDEDFSKKVRTKYYGLALIVRLIVERLTDEHLSNYDEKYFPALSNLADENERIRSDNVRLLNELENRSHAKLKIEQNIRSLENARSAIDRYREVLEEKREKVADMRDKASRDARVARFTLQTLEHVMNVGDVASRALEEFNSLSQLKPPDLLPLDNDKLYDEFLDISKELAVRVVD